MEKRKLSLIIIIFSGRCPCGECIAYHVCWPYVFRPIIVCGAGKLERNLYSHWSETNIFFGGGSLLSLLLYTSRRKSCVQIFKKKNIVHRSLWWRRRTNKTLRRHGCITLDDDGTVYYTFIIVYIYDYKCILYFIYIYICICLV